MWKLMQHQQSCCSEQSKCQMQGCSFQRKEPGVPVLSMPMHAAPCTTTATAVQCSWHGAARCDNKAALTDVTTEPHEQPRHMVFMECQFVLTVPRTQPGGSCSGTRVSVVHVPL
jgi:hypothetical protein